MDKLAAIDFMARFINPLYNRPLYMLIGKTFPEPRDSEIRFETYRFYLDSFRRFLNEEYQNWESFGHRIVNETRTLQGLKEVDHAWIERFLKISWNTEYLICAVSVEDVELLRISNQWIPIQSYYAVYCGAEAVSQAIDGKRAGSHATALRKVTSHFIQCGVPPWNMAFTGASGKGGSDHCPLNFPKGIRIPHNLERASVKPIEMIAKCLKAEHSHQIAEHWKRSKGIRKYAFDPGPTSLLHFLYRLRIKSNYQDIDAFITNSTEADIRSFYNSLKTITFWTLFYFEIVLCRKIKKKTVCEYAERYLKINSRADQIEQRLAFIRKAI